MHRHTNKRVVPHGWHSRTPANQRWDQAPAMNARDTTKVYIWSFDTDKPNLPTLCMGTNVLQRTYMYQYVSDMTYSVNFDVKNHDKQKRRNLIDVSLVWKSLVKTMIIVTAVVQISIITW